MQSAQRLRTPKTRRRRSAKSASVRLPVNGRNRCRLEQRHHRACQPPGLVVRTCVKRSAKIRKHCTRRGSMSFPTDGNYHLQLVSRYRASLIINQPSWLSILAVINILCANTLPWHDCMLPCLQWQQLQRLKAKLSSVCCKTSSKQRLQLLRCKP